MDPLAPERFALLVKFGTARAPHVVERPSVVTSREPVASKCVLDSPDSPESPESPESPGAIDPKCDESMESPVESPVERACDSAAPEAIESVSAESRCQMGATEHESLVSAEPLASTAASSAELELASARAESARVESETRGLSARLESAGRIASHASHEVGKAQGPTAASLAVCNLTLHELLAFGKPW